MPGKAEVRLTTATKEGQILPPGQTTKVEFWPSGGRDVNVVTDESGERVQVLFLDTGFTRKNLVLEITGKDLNVVFRSTR